MKSSFANFILFAALCVAFSSFTACGTASTQKEKSPVIVSPSNVSIAPNSTTAEVNGANFPPVPSGLYQAEIKDLEGKTFKLEDKKGKVVLVNLWATWCGPCIAEMPHLKEMQDKYQARGFEVLGLNTGDNETGEAEPVEKIKAFVAQKQLNYPIGYADENFFSQMLKVTRMAGIPQSILINREGKMTGIFKGGGSAVISRIKETVDKTMSE
ncbi:MAG: TlpA family protein disulfide reductase [Pyrinomonadaceae bacterium]|nr:TlpA family protein disulfide reductase [Pyrinomonadaceae bacterium]